MSILCLEYYAMIENNTLKFDEILDNIKTDNDNLMLWCLDHDFINCGLKDLLDSFPKYLNYSNIIDTKSILSGYNQESIYNTTILSYDQLNSGIVGDAAIRTLQKKINNIPEYYDDQIKEFALQNNYINSISESYFNKNLFIYNYMNTNYTDRFSDLLNDRYNLNELDEFRTRLISTYSFFHIYFLNSLTNNIFKENSNLQDNLLNNIDDFDIPDLSSSLADHIENVVDVVLANQFSFVDISAEFKTRLLDSEDIQENILEIETLFTTYLNNTNNLTTLKSNITEILFDLINNTLSFELTKLNFHLESRFNFDEINQINYESFNVLESNNLMDLYLPTDTSNLLLADFENNMYRFHISSINNSYSLKHYFYLLYLYRSKIQKFVNVIDIVSAEFVSNNIHFNDIYYFNTFEQMNQLFSQWSDCIIYDVFGQDLIDTYTADKYLTVLEDYPEILKFSLIFELYKQIESFVKTDAFKQQVINIQNSIFKYLRNQGLVDSNVDWCDCTFPLEAYLFFALKNITEDVDTTDLKAYATTQINNSVYKQFQVVLYETINLNDNDYSWYFYSSTETNIIYYIDIESFHFTPITIFRGNNISTITLTKILTDDLDELIDNSWMISDNKLYFQLEKPFDKSVNTVNMTYDTNENEFEDFCNDFNIKYSFYLFEFYKAFAASTVSSVFSEAIHKKYSL